MILSYWTLAVALCLSLVAAWYSIAGLAAIFAASVVPIIIMGSIMEVAKITVTVWLHEYWQYCKRSMRLQLTASVILLMFITSMGIFGYLSKAHSDQSLVSGDVMAKISIYDEKIKTAKDNIDANRKALKQMDEAVDQVMGRSADEKGADKAVALRRGQAKERTRLLQEIAAEQKLIAQLSEERAPIAAEVRKVEAEVGPIKYIAALVYGDNPDANLLERAVRWVIVILVLVFDPLAVMMVLASTESIKWEREGKHGIDFETEHSDPPEPETKTKENSFWPMASAFWPFPKVDPPKDPPEEKVEPNEKPTPVAIVQPEVDLSMYDDERLVSKFDKESGFVSPNAPGLDASLERPGDYLTPPVYDEDYETPEVKEAQRRWKELNPNDTLKHQRHLYEDGKIAELPWMRLLADNEVPRDTKSGFGTRFPDNPSKGDVFVRVDHLPTTLHKFNGKDWIQVDKSLTDNYTYDNAYIDHLIDKISSGELEVELLSDGEREQIAQQLQSRTT